MKAGFLCLAAVPLAYALPQQPGSISIPFSRRSPNPSVNDLQLSIERLRRTRDKYGMAPSREVLVKRAGTAASVKLAGSDLSYYASITLGTPAKTFEVVMDTGSSDLVMATALSNVCGGFCNTTGPLYSVAGSTSSTTNNTPFKIAYGTANASGILVRDVMGFAGFQATQAFGACNKLEAITSAPDQTGLLGMAWRTLSASNSTPFVQGLWESGALLNPLFAFGLNQLDSVSVPDVTAVVPGGILTIGDVNATLFTGSINYTPLSDAGSYWSIPLQNVAVGDKVLGLTNNAAVIDTGTNGIVVPLNAAKAIYGAIPGSVAIPNSGGMYKYPCATSVTISLTFGGISYPMQPRDFNGGTLDNGGVMCAGAFFSGGPSTSGPSYIIGSPFLMSVYSVYRFSPPSVGFALMAPSAALFLATGPIPSSASGGTGVVGGGLGGNFTAVAVPVPAASAGGTVAKSAAGRVTAGSVLGLFVGAVGIMV